MTFKIKPWLVLNSIHTRDKVHVLICLSFLYIYIKAFCKLQIAKAGLMRGGGGSIFSPFIYQNRLSIDPQYSLDVLSMDPRWTLETPSKHPLWTLYGPSLYP